MASSNDEINEDQGSRRRTRSCGKDTTSPTAKSKPRRPRNKTFKRDEKDDANESMESLTEDGSSENGVCSSSATGIEEFPKEVDVQPSDGGDECQQTEKVIEDKVDQTYNADSPTHSEDEDTRPEESVEMLQDDTRPSPTPNQQVPLEQDTELVSEDELPSESIKAPLETEAVSDEELPSNATDILETEAVSEDELPLDAKKKKSANSQSSDGSGKSDSIERKMKGDDKHGYKRSPSRGRSQSPPSKRLATDSKGLSKQLCKVKSLPELEKYWKAVREDSTDFTGWTYLLQYVDQENDVEAAREAYDTFLSHYPYCYGYWRKYADYEKRKGDESKCEEVFERGLKAIPLSVDLWIHYLNYCKSIYKDNDEHLRKQFQRAIDLCGLEFRSDRLWESFIKWEMDAKNVQNVCSIYDKLIATPTQNYKTHFENFEDFVRGNQPNKILSVDEFLSMRSEVLQKIKQKAGQDNPSSTAISAPPGDDSDNDDKKSPTFVDEETSMMREKIIAKRKKIFKNTVSSVVARWNYEEGIKRPYFHVKPLERCQLNNWRDYLDFEVAQGNKERTIILFERCLIACALYEEFWVKFIKYLETLSGDDVNEMIRDVYERACTIHHPKKPMLSYNWALFEENLGNIEGARKVLQRIEKEVPNLMQVIIRRINVERRQGNHAEACRLFEHYIASVKSKSVANTLAFKCARYYWKVLNDPGSGVEIIRKALEKDKDNFRLYFQMLDMILMKPGAEESEFLSTISQALERDNIDVEHKVLLCQRRIEFLEDFGSSSKHNQKAMAEYMSYLKLHKERKRKQHEAEKMKQEEMMKKSKDSGMHCASGLSPSQNVQPSSSYSNNAAYQSGGTSYSQNNQGSSYQGSGSNQYSQQSYSQPPFNQYSQSDQNYNNYQNWGYSQPGYGNYNQGWGGYNYYS